LELSLLLIKQDKDSRKRLAGAQFRWRDTVNGNTGVVTTNSNGEAILYNFSVNRVYEITEFNVCAMSIIIFNKSIGFASIIRR
jgi:hypothetical protein